MPFSPAAPRRASAPLALIGALTCAASLEFPLIARCQDAPADAIPSPVAAAAPKAAGPSAAEVSDLLTKEPISLATWPRWRGRLLAWFDDPTENTAPAYDAARTFAKGQLDANDQLPAELAGDYLAWYFVGHGFLYDQVGQAGLSADAKRIVDRAEHALRKCLELEPGFPRAHRSLGMMFMSASRGSPADLDQAAAEFKRTKELDPNFDFRGVDGQLALQRDRPIEAEQLFAAALDKHPQDAGLAVLQGIAILKQEKYPGSRRGAIQKLAARFPEQGDLASELGAAAAMENDPRAAAREFARARTLGADPARLFDPKTVAVIEAAGRPAWYEQFGWLLLYAGGFYLVVMGGMALAGVILAQFTRGRHALALLQADPGQMLRNGEVARAAGETALARMYGLALCAGLVLFYLSLPFVIIGLLGGTAALLQLVFSLGRIPIKLVIVVVIVGLASAWAVLKSVFTRPGSGSFGIPKSAEEIPHVHALSREVAQKINTEPVDEIYLAPGSEISVHQAGRGPFGIFGVKKRVLTLGMSNLRFLTVGELAAILAHEYGHFSHDDTFYGRFIYQVTLSIDRALAGMGQAGGALNYFNPFFWFLYLYHRCYSLLAAGYSRSREFLADRMACCVYGSDVFTSGLRKVATEGTLFEETMPPRVQRLVAADQCFENMFQSFQEIRENELSETERNKSYRKALDEKDSLFASHPTFRQRVEAVAGLPKARHGDDRSALELFDDPAAVEKELTEFLASYFFMIHRVQAEARKAARARA